jgi:hypothetical protein
MDVLFLVGLDTSALQCGCAGDGSLTQEQDTVLWHVQIVNLGPPPSSTYGWLSLFTPGLQSSRPGRPPPQSSREDSPARPVPQVPPAIPNLP